MPHQLRILEEKVYCRSIQTSPTGAPIQAHTCINKTKTMRAHGSSQDLFHQSRTKTEPQTGGYGRKAADLRVDNLFLEVKTSHLEQNGSERTAGVYTSVLNLPSEM